jgi:glucose-6-phosphate 1-epimerase
MAVTLSKMQTLTELNENFAIPGVLSFEEGDGGFLRARVTSASCNGAMYLYGAHVTEWQPAGQAPGIFLSEHSKYEAGKAIRGGVPLIFPWFGARDNAPVHGFARTSVWSVSFAAVVGDAVHLTMTLMPSAVSRELGYDHFRLAYEVVFGKELTLRLSVANDGEKPLEFEEGLHSYVEISDIEKIGIEGLKGTKYLDKVDGFKRKTQQEEVLRFSSVVDRPYLNTEATVTVEDAGMHRKVVMAKQGSKTTVIWNPWEELAATLGDMAPGEWRRMVCVEAVNAGENKVTLAPKEAHTMEARFSVVKA